MRTIIETSTPGWFLDPATDKKTRKQEGDNIMSQAEYDATLDSEQAKLDAEPSQVPPTDPQGQVDGAASTDDGVTRTDAQASADNAAEAEREANRKQTVSDAAAQAPVQLTSGKLVTGKTVTIRCSFIEGQLHDKPWADLTPAEKRKACGAERTIKIQDSFQVRRCIPHQKKHRNALKRNKTAERKQERATAKAGA